MKKFFKQTIIFVVTSLIIVMFGCTVVRGVLI